MLSLFLNCTFLCVYMTMFAGWYARTFCMHTLLHARVVYIQSAVAHFNSMPTHQRQQSHDNADMDPCDTAQASDLWFVI